MNILVFIVVILFIVYLLSQLRKFGKDYQTGQLENYSSSLFLEVQEHLKDRIKDITEMPQEISRFIHPEDRKIGLADAKKDLQKLEETHTKYRRLAEKLRHSNGKEKLQLQQDWVNYLFEVKGIVNSRKKLDTDPDNDAVENFQKSAHEHRIIIEEINNRFDRKLEL